MGRFYHTYLRPLARLAFLCGAIAGLLTSPPLGAGGAVPLVPFRAVYEVESNGLTVGTLTRSLIYTGDGYRFESNIATTGLAALLSNTKVFESSEGTFTPTQFLPTRYLYRREGRKKTKLYEVVFDRTADRAHGNAGGERQEFALPPLALDKLSYQLAVMHDLALPDQTLTYAIADVDRVKHYELVRAPAAPLGFGKTTYETIEITHQRSGSQRRTTLWCAPALAYMPLKIEYRERDGKITRAFLQELSRD